MTEYTVRPKAAKSIVWEGYPRASLGISLGNSNVWGDKFLSIVRWLNKNFEEVVIDLSDTLYRWNEYDENGRIAFDAMSRASTKGDQWIVKNIDSLDEFEIPYRLIRWNHWLKHAEFNARLNDFNNMYSRNEKFRQAVAQDVQIFLDRQKKAGLNINQRAREDCFNFLFEELAAHTLLLQTYPNTMQVYPGKDPECISIIRHGEILDAPVGIPGVPFVSLRIERASEPLRLIEPTLAQKLCA